MTGWCRLALVGIALGCAALGGCEFLAGDPLSWSSGIDLQFDIPDGQRHDFLQVVAPGPALFRPGSIFLQGANLKMNGAPQPKTLTVGLERHDLAFTESEFYEIHVPVKPNGRWKKKVNDLGGCRPARRSTAGTSTRRGGDHEAPGPRRPARCARRHGRAHRMQVRREPA